MSKRRWIVLWALALTLCAGGAADEPAAPTSLDRAAAGRFAELALVCLHREYPNKIAHVMGSDADARPPHELTPAFYGTFAVYLTSGAGLH